MVAHAAAAAAAAAAAGARIRQTRMHRFKEGRRGGRRLRKKKTINYVLLYRMGDQKYLKQRSLTACCMIAIFWRNCAPGG
jgi:hypothetical protein